MTASLACCSTFPSASSRHRRYITAHAMTAQRGARTSMVGSQQDLLLPSSGFADPGLHARLLQAGLTDEPTLLSQYVRPATEEIDGDRLAQLTDRVALDLGGWLAAGAGS
ncbi:hypothetical protein WJX72_001800 [[Myrmecia] bisecta]|uniref:Uncharacterized protein n=1 Tax=[Myrmecia] bisecta TaxID=41462 RepID=A0AAW1QQG4_9CHLO